MKPNYNFIFWDVDDTLVNFKKSEKSSLNYCLEKYGVTLSDEDVAIYSEINHNYWKLLELGKISKPDVLVRRFNDFFKLKNIRDIDTEQINIDYQNALGKFAVMYDHAYDLCEKYQCRNQYVVSNGTAKAQYGKLSLTGLGKLMDGIFISDEIGFEKPDIRFFEKSFSQIPNFKKEEAIIIGDSLTSDIKGANNIGIKCCWFNPRNQPMPTDLKIDYVIHDLKELYEILG